VIKDTIKNFGEQFQFDPEVKYETNLPFTPSTIVAGMGGSALGAGLVLAALPQLKLRIHREYDLPKNIDSKELVIASSYSGNTEETISAYDKALHTNQPLAAISVGGKILAKADHDQIPHIALPDTGIQPRMSLGYNVIALLKLLRQEKEIETIKSLTKIINIKELEEHGQKLATILHDRVPIIYASNQNQSLAYIGKISFNETGKIPAFMNVIPEMNHNEMTGFDRLPKSKSLSDQFVCVFINDHDDHPRIQKRTALTRRFIESKGLRAVTIEAPGSSRWEKIFRIVIMFDWAAHFISEYIGADSTNVPMVEDFKKELGS